MFSLFVTAEVVALTSGSYLLRLLHCKGSRWEYATEDHLLVLGQMESLKLWECPEDCKYALPVMLLKVLELLAVLHSSLQPTFLTFSFLCHTVFPDYIVPPCALNYQRCFVLFCVLSIYWAYLVYWMVKLVPAGKQQGVGVWKQTGGKQNRRNCLFQHQQEVFVRGRIGTVFSYAYLLLSSKRCPLWSYLSRDSS